MIYDSYTYLFPPRPEAKIAPNLLSFHERQGFHAQVKRNGTCTVIFARGDEVIFKTRHPETENGEHLQWKPLEAHLDFFRGFDTWYVFVGELMHNKTKNTKNQLYLFDMIVADGVQLIGSTFTERQARLLDMWKLQDDERDQFRVGEYVGVAKSFSTGFRKMFQEADEQKLDEVEGLVLKRPTAKLTSCIRDTNAGWQVKCRRPHKNYTF